MSPEVTPERIGITEALVHLAPFRIKRSTFYGSSREPGPRWTMIDELDICDGPPITMDRRRFYRWIKTLKGKRAIERSANAGRLGENAMPAIATESYGDHLSVLCSALAAGMITQEQFDRAVADLDSTM